MLAIASKFWLHLQLPKNFIVQTPAVLLGLISLCIVNLEKQINYIERICTFSILDVFSN